MYEKRVSITEVAVRPLSNDSAYACEFAASDREAVIPAVRSVRNIALGDDSGIFKLTQAVAEHGARNRLERRNQLVETKRMIGKFSNDGKRPPVANN